MDRAPGRQPGDHRDRGRRLEVGGAFWNLRAPSARNSARRFYRALRRRWPQGGLRVQRGSNVGSHLPAPGYAPGQLRPRTGGRRGPGRVGAGIPPSSPRWNRKRLRCAELVSWRHGGIPRGAPSILGTLWCRLDAGPRPVPWKGSGLYRGFRAAVPGMEEPGNGRGAKGPGAVQCRRLRFPGCHHDSHGASVVHRRTGNRSDPWRAHWSLG